MSVQSYYIFKTFHVASSSSSVSFFGWKYLIILFTFAGAPPKIASFRFLLPFLSFIGVLLRWGEVRADEDEVEGASSRSLMFSLIRNLSMEFTIGSFGFLATGVVGGVEFSEWRISRMLARGSPLLGLRLSPRNSTCEPLKSSSSWLLTACCRASVISGSIAGNKFLLIGVLWLARCRGDDGLGPPEGMGTRLGLLGE